MLTLPECMLPLPKCMLTLPECMLTLPERLLAPRSEREGGSQEELVEGGVYWMGMDFY